MDSSDSNRFDIFEIYRRYCDVRSGKAYKDVSNGPDDETQSAKFSRHALAQLLKFVESSLSTSKEWLRGKISMVTTKDAEHENWLYDGLSLSFQRLILNIKSPSQLANYGSNNLQIISIFDEILKLKLKLGHMVDFSEFSCFYDFVFFVCRENGQKNVTVSKAVPAWKLVLVGRFRLLNQWCDFVQENQRHNISEDTWQQVLAFSRCVHENLEGYDPEGAWPVLIDDFVEHMYRVSGSNKDLNFFCSCGDSESQSCVSEDPLPGLRIAPGLKRKLSSFEQDEMEASDTIDLILNSKRRRLIDYRLLNWDDNQTGNSADECMEVIRQSNPLGSTKSPCAVEGCLSKGFAGLFSTRPYLQLDRERRVSYA